MAKSAQRKRGKKKQNFFVRWYRETIGELRKVNWPTRREAVNLTIIVLIVTFSMSIFLGLLDFLYSQVFAWIVS